jgi:hypothetical protein
LQVQQGMGVFRVSGWRQLRIALSEYGTLIPPIPPAAAYFVLLGLLALTATVDPLVAPVLPRKLSETQFNFKLLKIPVVLKVLFEGMCFREVCLRMA